MKPTTPRSSHGPALDHRLILLIEANRRRLQGRNETALAQLAGTAVILFLLYG